MKNIAVIGSTGSIGTQTLEVVRTHSESFKIEVLTAFNNADLLIDQALEFKPNVVVIGNDDHYSVVFEALDQHDIKVYSGQDSIEQIISLDNIEQVVLACPGISGLKPLLATIKQGKDIALANKEAIVVGGELVVAALKKSSSRLIPIDSEHSAIFQCLSGEPGGIKKIYLTASGGPFLNFSYQELKNVKPEQALKHPIWKMGQKITIDSASLMNKGMEIIEAYWLYQLQPSQIDVLIHPQSFIHSMVEFIDGSIKAQLARPDMKIPIQYALSFPHRIEGVNSSMNPLSMPALHFEAPDFEKFRNLALAIKALNKGGNSPCVLNSANEVAVNAFLNEQIGFLQIPEIVEKCLDQISLIKHPTLNEYIETDIQTSALAKSLIKELKN